MPDEIIGLAKALFYGGSVGLFIGVCYVLGQVFWERLRG